MSVQLMYLTASRFTLESMNSGEPWRLGHRPALDGVRGIAILLVVACHLAKWWWPNALGSIGVTVFFTLSGFLITALLLEEAARGPVSLAGFYRRRARRLFPALVVMVAFAGSLMVTTGIAPLSAIWWALSYVGNWDSAREGITALLGHTWSLAIEEQFYIVWPVALLAARRWRHGPLVVVGAGIAASVVLRALLWNGGAGVARVYFGSDTRADGLLVGCALAILLHSGVQLRVPAKVAVGVAAAGLAALAVSGSDWVVAVATPTAVPWITVLLLLHALTSPRWLCGPVLGWFGRRSYGIYLWNWPIVCGAALWTGMTSKTAVVLATLVGLGVAELSWRIIEEPFLRRNQAAISPSSRSRRVLPGQVLRTRMSSMSPANLEVPETTGMPT